LLEEALPWKLQNVQTAVPPVQVYTHPTDPSWEGFRPDSVFYGSEVGNRLPASSYASYDLVEAARSMLAVALQGMTYLHWK